MHPPAINPIFAPVVGLPRGPHRLTRDEVAESQRTRLMAALTRLLADRGWAGITVGALAREAGVSLATFYQHFADKTGCLLAAYDHFARAIRSEITAGLGSRPTWDEFVNTAIAGYVGVIARDTSTARAFFVEMDAAGPAARNRRRQEIHTLAGLLAGYHEAIRARDPTLESLPNPVFFALAVSVRELAREALESTPADLSDMAASIRTVVTALTSGATN
jgi:AcrR family transcriptional regulator